MTTMMADATFGIKAQELAVLHMLAAQECNIEDLYVSTAPWYNGRERGILLMYQRGGEPCLRIAVFEHRNSDSLHALKWEAPATMNPPTIDTEGKLAYPSDSKWDTAHSVGYGKIGEMVEWICKQVDAYAIKYSGE